MQGWLFYSSVAAQGKCCRRRIHARPAGNAIISQPSEYSLVRQHTLSNFQNPLII